MKSKVLKIVLIVFLVIVGLGIGVSYIIHPEITRGIFDYVVELCNKPLPIIGITTGAVLLFIWQIFKNTAYGKNVIGQYETRYRDALALHGEYEAKVNGLLSEKQEQIDFLKAKLIEICALSTNQKVKAFGKELENGKEEVISNTTTK